MLLTGARQRKSQVPYWKKLSNFKNHSALDPVLATAEQYRVTVGSEHTTKLLKDAGKAYNTEINDLLVAALGIAMTAATGQSKNPVNIEGIGRLSDEADVSWTVGWFTILYPAQLDTSGSIGDAVVMAKELLKSVPDKGLGYWALTQRGDLKENLARVVFNYLGQLGGTGQDYQILVAETGEEHSKNRDPRFSIEIQVSLSSC